MQKYWSFLFGGTMLAALLLFIVAPLVPGWWLPKSVSTFADGIDGLFVGPGDLAASLGHPGEPGHPDVVAAVEDAIRRVVRLGKPAGILTPDPAFARRCMALGTTFTAVGIDAGILARASERLAADFRS